MTFRYGARPAASARRPTASMVVAGDGLLHPVVLVAIAILLINDHALKSTWPGFVTGKLSDLAGLLFFPLLLQAVVEVATSWIGRPSRASTSVLAAAILLTALVFSAVNIVPVAGDAYRVWLGTLQWLLGALPATLLGLPAGTAGAVHLTPDPTDLIALPVLAVSYAIGASRAEAARARLD